MFELSEDHESEGSLAKFVDDIVHVLNLRKLHDVALDRKFPCHEVAFDLSQEHEGSSDSSPVRS